MTVKTLAYCDAPGCEVSAPIYPMGDRTIPFGWIEVFVGQHTAGEQFCSMTCLSTWALAEQERRDRDAAIQTTMVPPRDKSYRFIKDPEHWKKEKPE